MEQKSFFVKNSEKAKYYHIDNEILYRTAMQFFGGVDGKGLITRRDTETLYVFSNGLWREWSALNFKAWITDRSIAEGISNLVTEQAKNNAYAYILESTFDMSDTEFGSGGVFTRGIYEYGHIIATPNCYIDILTGEKMEPRASFYKTSMIPMFIPPDDDINKFSCPEFEAMLDRVYESDISRIQLYKEMCGYCLIGDSRFNKIFIAYGDGGTGKSAVLNVLKFVLNGSTEHNSNVSSLAMDQFANSFQLATLAGKFANICDENPRFVGESTAIMKMISDGGTVMINPKFKNPFYANMTTKLIFSANEKPKFNEENNSIQRRVEFLWHGKRFDNDPNKVNMISQEIFKKEGKEIFKMFICAARDLINQNGFTKSFDSMRIYEEMKIENSVTAQFIQDTFAVTEDPNDYVLAQGIYEKYKEWCASNDIRYRKSQQLLQKDLPKYMPLGGSQVRKIGGKSVRVFCGLKSKSLIEEMMNDALS